MSTFLVVLGLILMAAGAFLISPALLLIFGGVIALRAAQLVEKGAKISG